MKSYREAGQFIIFALIFVLFLAVIRPFIIPVILGLIICLVFRPIYIHVFGRMGKRRHLAASVCTLMVIIGVLLPLVLIGTFVAKDVSNLVKTLGEISDSSSAPVEQVMRIPALETLYAGLSNVYPMSEEAFASSFQSAIKEGREYAKTVLKGIAASVPRTVVALIFFLIAFYFGVVDGAALVDFLRDNSPFSLRDTNQLFLVTGKICNAVILGAFLAGVVQGIIVGTFYWILRIPQPLLFGVLTAVFSLVPLVGCAPTCIGGTLYLLAVGRPISALVMLGAFLLASISDNVVKPWVLRGKTELHPLLGLLSVLGGLRLFGVSGLFLGPVITALSIALLQLLHRRVSKTADAPPAAA